jgi:hypothetical protein
MSRRVLRIVTSLLLVVLTVGSLQPARPRLSTGVHREIHWLAFGGAALLLFCLSRGLRQEVLSAFATVLLGLSLEVLQHIVYRNRMEWRDVVDDALAICAAFVLYRLTGARKPAPDPPN